MVADDRQFVISGWSSSMRTTRDLALIPMRDYADIVHPIINGYLDHREVHTLVEQGDEGVLRGFIVFDPRHYNADSRSWVFEGYVYYLYVAAPFRGWKIAARLVAATGIDPAKRFGYAVRTRSSFEARGKIPLAEYQPHRARFLSTESP